MKSSKLRNTVLVVSCAIGFMALGVVIRLARDESRGPLDHVAREFIARAEPMPFGPSTDVSKLLDHFRVSTFAAATAIRGRPQLSRQQAADFADAARAQLAKFVPASYEAYRALMGPYTEVRPHSAFEARRQFFKRRRNGPWAVIPLDPSVVHVQAYRFRGERIDTPFDSGGYSLAPGIEWDRELDLRETIYEVALPAEIDDPSKPGQRISFVFALAFRLEPDGQWTPWGVGDKGPANRLREIDAFAWGSLSRR
jgi:hypothetical protein